MPAFTQENRHLRVETPLDDDVLLLTDLSGYEGLSTLFTFDLHLLAQKASKVDFDKIVGEPMTVTIQMADGERYINGIVSRFAQGGVDRDFATFHAQIVPTMWLLTRTSDCRIFQKKSVPDILKEIFSGVPVKFQLQGSFEPRDYCVQYRETDYNFACRLMEEEGIFFFFEHEAGKHTLVVANAPGAHKPCPLTAKAIFLPGSEDDSSEDTVTQFRKEQEIRPGKYTATDYNMEIPSVDLSSNAEGGDKRHLELYEFPEFPGETAKRSAIDAYVKVRQQEQDTTRIRFVGAGYRRSFVSGYRFDLDAEGENAIFKGTYVLTSVRHTAGEGYGQEETGVAYRNDFECIQSSVPYRPARRTPRPSIVGLQTAVVVGPGGEEIFTDKYSRVKVHFHWDREGKKNENSSCWVRVAQPWAGKNWGFISIPRIGQEVTVSFIEGDPDRPMIVGSVYNAEQMPPYELPANMTQSGIKTRSSKGGSPANFNEIRFEDMKGSEQLFIHAEKNQDIEVENDETHWVGHNRTKTIDHDETTHVKHDRTETVDNNETIAIGGNRSETVNKNETLTVTMARTHTVGLNEAISVGVAQEVAVGAAQTVTVGAARTVSVGGSQTTNVGGNQSENIGKSQSAIVGKDRSATIGENDTLDVGKKLVIKAGEEITIQTGDASILLKKDGSIQIKGKDIVVEGSGKLDIKASKNITMKGQKILQN